MPHTQVPPGSTRAALGAIAASVLALGLAYYAQFAMLLAPCPLCLWERWPYRAVIVLGIVALIAPGRLARWALGLAVVGFFATTAIAFVHVGVEQHWWKSPLPECNAFMPHGTLLAAPAPPCDDPSYFFRWLPISIATLDFLYATVCGVILWAWLARATWLARAGRP
jgi:disulfide bond formation protein DsbB